VIERNRDNAGVLIVLVGMGLLLLVYFLSPVIDRETGEVNFDACIENFDREYFVRTDRRIAGPECNDHLPVSLRTP
jgi:hypothetical protein